jgi:DNA-binding response OmpR family regulator
MRDLLVAVFRRSGYEVIPMQDGNALIEHLRDEVTTPPDLIITDVIMPGVDGFGVLREVERLSVPTAVILITAFGDAITHRRALEHGAAEVVDKPFDIDAIRALVQRILPP